MINEFVNKVFFFCINLYKCKKLFHFVSPDESSDSDEELLLLELESEELEELLIEELEESLEDELESESLSLSDSVLSSLLLSPVLMSFFGGLLFELTSVFCFSACL